MSFVNKSTALARVLLPRCSRCLYSSDSGSAAKDAGGGEASTPTPAPAAPTPAAPAPAAPKPTPTTTASQPFDNTKYNCEMYYNFNEMSYYDIENEMAAKRVGQPSSLATK